ncbi:class-III pyridoxal-phosphate-dependent aminotransferase [Aureliella helgolandensis]|uniref:5-aminovalerate aminotransferase DavT n=1 Tax=Aureliella helgolandensis TaxID=2527968 RepID=A0A518GDD0_9BACT|nr:aspartate aminotransferase family protein [Aureliella helgolandensis]QDV26560.1 5-aminovalerate aminotransferase DavT [Aureliella helgolandensis]
MHSADWQARASNCLTASAARWHDPKYGIVFTHGRSATLWDVDGRDYIDLTCGYSVSNFGHAFPPISDVVARQAGQLSHLTGELHPQKIQLAEQLLQHLWNIAARPPGVENAPTPSALHAGRADAGKVVFNSTGARAVETAWKAAVAFRPGKLVALELGFHGRSIATSPLSQLGQSTPTDPQLAPEAYCVWPTTESLYCEQCPLGKVHPACQLACTSDLFEEIEQQASTVSAILVEPAWGARGYIFPPQEFFLRLRQITRRHGIVLIADEIQTGLGRCGDWLLSHAQGWQADLTLVGKSLGGGVVPISAVVGSAAILESIPQNTESETFAASPFACNVALETLRQLASGHWFKQAQKLGAELREMVGQIVKTTGIPCRIDGQGAVCTIEFASQERPIELAQRRTLDVMKRCVALGLLVHYTGPRKTRIVLLPPFTILPEELEATRRRLQQVFTQSASSA